MHMAAWSWIAKCVRDVGPFASVVELGGRNVNGSVRDLFGEAAYLAVDIADGPGVDVVADCRSWEPGRTFAAVVCCEVFEHCEGWRDIARTAYRACAPGGAVMLTMAGPGRAPHSGIDGMQVRSGEFYANVSPADLDATLNACGFVSVIVVNEGYDVYALARRGQ